MVKSLRRQMRQAVRTASVSERVVAPHPSFFRKEYPLAVLLKDTRSLTLAVLFFVENAAGAKLLVAGDVRRLDGREDFLVHFGE